MPAVSACNSNCCWFFLLLQCVWTTVEFSWYCGVLMILWVEAYWEHADEKWKGSSYRHKTQSSAIKVGKILLVMFCPLVGSLYMYFLRICIHSFLKGANAPASNGCKRWVVFSGRQSSMMLWSQASFLRCRLVWEWWLLKNSTTGAVAVECETAGTNSLVNQDKNYWHPSSQKLSLHTEVQLGHMFFLHPE